MESIIIRGEVVTFEEFNARIQQGVADMMPTLIKVRASLDTESDRGAALSGAAFLDDVMKDLLKAYFQYCVGRDGFPDGGDHESIFKDLSGVNGPIGQFSSRAKMLYMLNLVTPQQFKHLKTVAKLRNKFAHILDVSSFADAAITTIASDFPSYVTNVSSLQPNKLVKLNFTLVVSDLGIKLIVIAKLIAEGLPPSQINFR